MSRLLRSDLDELDVYVTRIADATGILGFFIALGRTLCVRLT